MVSSLDPVHWTPTARGLDAISAQALCVLGHCVAVQPACAVKRFTRAESEKMSFKRFAQAESQEMHSISEAVMCAVS